MLRNKRKMKEKTEHKFFNGRKYYLNNRWKRTTYPHIQLSHDVWNYRHPEDEIESNGGYVIHHKNKDKSDDNIENLEKMLPNAHNALHREDMAMAKDILPTIKIHIIKHVLHFKYLGGKK